jgi:putative spermidine/putrescine transport system permease protein
MSQKLPASVAGGMPPSMPFTLSFVGMVIAAAGIVAGISTAHDFSEFLLTVGAGSVLAIGYCYAMVSIFDTRRPAMIVTAMLGALVGLSLGSVGGAVFGVLAGAVVGYLIFWIHYRGYRKGLPNYLTSEQILWHYTFRMICGVIFIFLITPVLVILPLSFNAQDFFTFTPEMLRFDPAGYSLKHYQDFFTNSDWQGALKNSLMIAPVATILAVTFGTLAAIGLSQPHVPFRRAIMAILISPMIVPLIISAAGMYFFYSRIGLQGTYFGVVLAHAALGIPFVIITVTATLVGFDTSLTRAAANMGANPLTTFFRVQMPLILPGVVSGARFAFITSFDEVVVVLFVGSAGQKTLPWQMFIGLREQISPTILAVATVLVAISVLLLATMEMLRRRSERLRGMSPS